ALAGLGHELVPVRRDECLHLPPERLFRRPESEIHRSMPYLTIGSLAARITPIVPCVRLHTCATWLCPHNARRFYHGRRFRSGCRLGRAEGLAGTSPRPAPPHARGPPQWMFMPPSTLMLWPVM